MCLKSQIRGYSSEAEQYDLRGVYLMKLLVDDLGELMTFPKQTLAFATPSTI